MRTMTAGRLAEGIRSYRDIVHAHRVLVAKIAAGKGSIFAEAAERLARLAELYRTPETLTDEIRAAVQDAFAAVDEAHRGQRPTVGASPFLLADARLDHLSLYPCSSPRPLTGANPNAGQRPCFPEALAGSTSQHGAR